MDSKVDYRNWQAKGVIDFNLRENITDRKHH
jgi:hypothetical protein